MRTPTLKSLAPLGFRYGVALLALAFAVVVQWLVHPYFADRFAVAFLFVAIVAAAWFGSFGPAALISVAGLFLMGSLFPPVEGTQGGGIVGFIFYFMITFGIAFLGAGMARARRRAEEAAEKLQTTLESIGDAVIVTDREGRIVSLNPVAEALTEWSSDDAAGQSLGEVFATVNAPSRLPIENPVTQVLEEGVIVSAAHHTILTTRSGLDRPIDNSAAPIRSRDGSILGCVLVFRDVTERKRIEETLRVSEQRFRSMADSVPSLIWMSGTDRLFNWFNRPWLEFTGRSIAQETGSGWYDNVHPDDVAYCAQTYSDAFAKQERFSMEYRLKRHDGEYRWLLSYGVPNYEAGEFRGYIGSCFDITDRKSAEKELQASETRFTQLADNIAQLAWMADENGTIFWYNRRWYEYTGTNLADMQREGLQKVLHANHQASVLRRLNHCFTTGSMWEDTFLLRSREGQFRWFLSRAMPIRNSEGSIDRWFGTCTDITDQRRDQEKLQGLASQLAEADRRKDTFLATLAHELRNPLAPIRTGLEIMKLSDGMPDDIEEVRSTMERQTQQLVTLVDDLLDVSRITRGKLELRKCQVGLKDVVQSAVEATRPLIDAARHVLTVHVPIQPICIHADPHRLAQVLSNLLSNSAKYTPEGGQIALTAELQGPHVLVTVKDNGIGIPLEKQGKIFEMFGQLEHPIQRMSSGLGIGLNLVKSLVEMHDGTITVRSEGENHGSEFVVQLPVIMASLPLEASELLGVAPSLAEPQRILVADDNKDAAHTLSLAMKMLGNEVRVAHNGQEALELAAEFRPDIVLMDIGMPGMNGYDVARHIRQQPWGEEMLLIAITGWGREEDKLRGKEAGFDHHLVKPADPAELQRLLSEPRPTREPCEPGRSS